MTRETESHVTTLLSYHELKFGVDLCLQFLLNINIENSSIKAVPIKEHMLLLAMSSIWADSVNMQIIDILALHNLSEYWLEKKKKKG